MLGIPWLMGNRCPDSGRCRIALNHPPPAVYGASTQNFLSCLYPWIVSLGTLIRCRLLAASRSTSTPLWVSYILRSWGWTPQGWCRPQWPCRESHRDSLPTHASSADCGWAASCLCYMLLQSWNQKLHIVYPSLYSRISWPRVWVYLWALYSVSLIYISFCARSHMFWFL